MTRVASFDALKLSKNRSCNQYSLHNCIFKIVAITLSTGYEYDCVFDQINCQKQYSLKVQNHLELLVGMFSSYNKGNTPS